MGGLRWLNKSPMQLPHRVLKVKLVIVIRLDSWTDFLAIAFQWRGSSFLTAPQPIILLWDDKKWTMDYRCLRRNKSEEGRNMTWKHEGVLSPTQARARFIFSFSSSSPQLQTNFLKDAETRNKKVNSGQQAASGSVDYSSAWFLQTQKSSFTLFISYTYPDTGERMRVGAARHGVLQLFTKFVWAFLLF